MLVLVMRLDVAVSFQCHDVDDTRGLVHLYSHYVV